VEKCGLPVFAGVEVVGRVAAVGSGDGVGCATIVAVEVGVSSHGTSAEGAGPVGSGPPLAGAPRPTLEQPAARTTHKSKIRLALAIRRLSGDVFQFCGRSRPPDASLAFRASPSAIAVSPRWRRVEPWRNAGLVTRVVILLWQSMLDWSGVGRGVGGGVLVDRSPVGDLPPKPA
jgi:hypothetical protein